MLYAMLIGTPPFPALSYHQLVKMASRPKANLKLPDRLPKDLCALLRSLLHLAPKQRLTLPQVARNPWFQEDLDHTLARSPGFIYPFTGVVPTLASGGRATSRVGGTSVLRNALICAAANSFHRDAKKDALSSPTRPVVSGRRVPRRPYRGPRATKGTSKTAVVAVAPAGLETQWSATVRYERHQARNHTSTDCDTSAPAPCSCSSSMSQLEVHAKVRVPRPEGWLMAFTGRVWLRAVARHWQR